MVRSDRVEQARPHRALLAVLGVITALALVGLGGAGAVLLGVGQRSVPSSDSVDAGFARDMTAHHLQAVLMAGIVRDRTTDPRIQKLAFDIELSQQQQVGQMQAWLNLWGLSENTNGPRMAWMQGGDMPGMHMPPVDEAAAMPGMASQEDLHRLSSASGKQLDVLFLQLMLHHHQGGIPMAEYAADHASLPQVRNLAEKMSAAQLAEIEQMTNLLAERGAQPLPPPEG